MLMVAGLCIGGAMIGLPTALFGLGMWGSLAMLITCWLFMSYTALLTYEVNTAYPPGCHFLTMAANSLGELGKWVTSTCYLVLLYSLVSAYLSASSNLLNDMFGLLAYDHLGVAMLLVLALVVGLVATGTTNVAKCNRFLMLALMATFFAMVAMVAMVLPQVHLMPAPQSFWHDIPMAGVVTMTSFGFHILVPTLRVYSQGDQRMMYIAILCGGGIALLMYILWVMVVFGAVPTETLAMIRDGDIGSAEMLGPMFPEKMPELLNLSGHYFILLAVVTSFIGVLVSLVDFLADSLSIHNHGVGKLKLLTLAVLPPIIFAIFFPYGFVTALTYAGIMVAILHGVLPALMAWQVREAGLETIYRAPGGNVSLAIVLGISSAIIVAECIDKWN